MTILEHSKNLEHLEQVDRQAEGLAGAPDLRADSQIVGSALVARIDRRAIEFNCQQLRAHAGGSVKLCVPVKANAYGHGLACVLPALESAGVEMVAVATIEESLEVRRLGFEGGLLLFGDDICGFDDRKAQQIANLLLEYRVCPTVMDLRSLQILDRVAQDHGRIVQVHVKVDSGMGRGGVDDDSAMELLCAAAGLRCVQAAGLYTHLATADQLDKSFALEQLARFDEFLARVDVAGLRPGLVHAANSGAVLDLPQAGYDMIRPGIGVYGCYPDPQVQNRIELRPALQVTARLAAVKKLPADHFVGYGCTFKTQRDTLIGLVPIGYADGYNRRLSNRAVMQINDVTVPVIGRVSMDCTAVDLTDAGPVSCGQEVVVINNQRHSANSVENLAQMIETIPYEITTLLGQRIKRIATG